MFFVALAAVIVWYVVSEKTKFSVWDVAALIPLGLSPYFLGCISYKYDAPYMALSVLASVIPLLLCKSGYFKYFIAAFLGTLAVCTTYQASSGIFPMLVILICIKWWNEKEENQKIVTFLGFSIVAYFLGLVIFKVFLMPQRDTYVSNSLPSVKELFPVIFSNLKRYFSLVIRDFKTEWLICVFLLCIAFVFVLVRDSKQKKYLSFFLSALALFVMLALAFGMYPVLSKPLFQVRAMYGFGVFIAFIGITVSTAKKTYSAKLVCMVLGWYFFVFSFIYGNALKVQAEYRDFRAMEVVNDLKDLDIMMSGEKVKIQMNGTIAYAPAIRKMPTDFNMVKRLVPIPSKDKWNVWMVSIFRYYDLKKVVWNQPYRSKVDFKTYDLPVLKDTIYHTIRGKDNCILIEMK